MTDRYDAVVLELDRDMRSDDAEELLTLLRNLKGVRRVTPHIAGWEQHMAREAARVELRDQIRAILWP